MNLDIMSQNRGERLILIYQHLPRGQKNALSVRQLLDKFNPTGDKADSRYKMLEKDLMDVRTLLGEGSVMREPDWAHDNIAGKTPVYYMHPDFMLDSLDNQTLFFWEMLDLFTAPYLPKNIHKQLTQKISSVQARQGKAYQQSELGKWKDHLITLPSLLYAPAFDDAILTTLHHAIQTQQTLAFEYRKKWHDTSELKTIYPVGLVFIDNMIYLTGFQAIGEAVGNDVIDSLNVQRNYAVHRILSAKVLDTPVASWVADFSLSMLEAVGMLEKHVTDVPEHVTLTLKIDRHAAEHLSERPLSQDQTIEPHGDETMLLTANVTNTLRLEDWLVSMSQHSEVLAPASMRERIIERLHSAIAQYQ